MLNECVDLTDWIIRLADKFAEGADAYA